MLQPALDEAYAIPTEHTAAGTENPTDPGPMRREYQGWPIPWGSYFVEALTQEIEGKVKRKWKDESLGGR